MTQVMYDVPSDPTIVKVTITPACRGTGRAGDPPGSPSAPSAPALGRSVPAGQSGADCPVPTRAERIHLSKHSCSPGSPKTAGPGLFFYHDSGFPSCEIPLERK